MRPIPVTNPTARSKSIDRLAQELLEQAETKFVGARRPNIRIEPEKVEAIRKAVELAGGSLTLPLGKVVELLELSPSFADPNRAVVFAGSLTRRLSESGITVGARNKGQHLTFRGRTKKKGQ
jgi:hypothetical protein